MNLFLPMITWIWPLRYYFITLVDFPAEYLA